jgi:hypothetical protein
MKNLITTRYIPEPLRNNLFHKNEEYGIEVYLLNNIAIGFLGRSAKASFHYRYQNNENALKSVREWITNVERNLTADKVKKEEKKQLQKTEKVEDHIKVGDVYYSSWGYEQTNVDFYQVVEVKGKRVRLVEIGKSEVESSGYSSMAGMFTADVLSKKALEKVLNDKEVGKWHGVKFNKYNEKIDVYLTGFARYECVSKWDGKPEYVSWYA